MIDAEVEPIAAWVALFYHPIELTKLERRSATIVARACCGRDDMSVANDYRSPRQSSCDGRGSQTTERRPTSGAESEPKSRRGMTGIVVHPQLRRAHARNRTDFGAVASCVR
jgi:hypothetical protein